MCKQRCFVCGEDYPSNDGAIGMKCPGAASETGDDKSHSGDFICGPCIDAHNTWDPEIGWMKGTPVCPICEERLVPL